MGEIKSFLVVKMKIMLHNKHFLDKKNVSLNHIGDDPVNFKRSKYNIYLLLEVVLMYIKRYTSLEKNISL